MAVPKIGPFQDDIFNLINSTKINSDRMFVNKNIRKVVGGRESSFGGGGQLSRQDGTAARL